METLWNFLLTHIGYIVTLPLLLAASAFFSGTETAFFNIENYLVRSFGNSSNRFEQKVAALLTDRHSLLVTILFGNMVVNILFFSLTSVISIDLAEAGHRRTAVVVGLVGLVAVILFGEIIPKAVAHRLVVGYAKAAAFPLWFLSRVVRPVCVVFEWLSKWLLRRALTRPGRGHLATEELEDMVQLSAREGHISTREKDMLDRVLTSCRLKVRDCMVARVDMTAFDMDDSIDRFLELARRSRHTRIPVYHHDWQNVLGMMHVRDVLLQRPSTTEQFKQLIRPVVFVPETKTLESLLADFQQGTYTSALAVDEFGGIEGLVTIEDVVEEIVGPIVDEFDAHQPREVEKLAPGQFEVDGEMNIATWEDTFEIELEKTRAATIGGFVTYLLGHIPREGETVGYGRVEFKVVQMGRRRIERLEIRLADEPDGPHRSQYPDEEDRP